MKNKRFKAVTKILSALLFSVMLLTYGIGTLSAAAEASVRGGALNAGAADVSRIPSEKSASAFTSKDLITGEESYYNVYKNGELLDFSEEAELAAVNGSDTFGESLPGYDPISERALNISTSTIQPKNIIGTDGRVQVTNTTAYPYSAICYIRTSWNDGTKTLGTAWMFWGDVAVTAGHCLYDESRGGWARYVELTPATNGYTAPYGAVYATTMHCQNRWIEDANWEYDYGVMKLSGDIGNSCGYFGISWTIWSLRGTDVTIAGYPTAYNRQMWKMSGEITSSSVRKIYYEIDVTEGQSGSPVYKSDNQVIGINTDGSATENSATRVTSAVFNYLSSFRE